MTFRKFLDSLSREHSEEQYYLNQQKKDKKSWPYSPVLRALHDGGKSSNVGEGDMPVPEIISEFKLKEFNMWLGSSNATTSPMHFDMVSGLRRHRHGQIQTLSKQRRYPQI